MMLRTSRAVTTQVFAFLFAATVMVALSGCRQSQPNVVVPPTQDHSVTAAAGGLSLDIKPGSCPNPLNPRKRGVLPLAILGSSGASVHDIDVSSILLEGVPPIRSGIDDVSTPAASSADCACTEAGPDGIDDLDLKFDTPAVIEAIGFVQRGDVRTLTVTGTLLDGTPFELSDCVTIVGRAPCGANWVKSGSNPIITGGFSGGSFDVLDVRTVSVLYDQNESVYKMWYSGLDNAGPPRARIGYATSPDGIVWTPHGPNPVVDLGPSGAFDDWHAYFPVVIKDGSTYKMWYTGDGFGRFYLGYATSSDGVNWTKYNGAQSGGSILDWQLEGWDRYTQTTSVIKDGAVYKMWFGEYGGSGGIGYATSGDGINWTIVGQVLPIGAPGGFEEWRIHWPSVVKNGSQYIMLYAGQRIGELRRFGLATSLDGINWNKYAGNPVLPLGNAGEMDDVGHYYPHIVLEGNRLKMWYSGHGTGLSMGYAESACPGNVVRPLDPKESRH